MRCGGLARRCVGLLGRALDQILDHALLDARPSGIRRRRRRRQVCRRRTPWRSRWCSSIERSMSWSTSVAVGFVVEQRLELGTAEQCVEDLAVHLDQQRIGAGIGHQRVEAAVEHAELVERHADPEFLRAAADRLAFLCGGALTASSKIGSSSTRRVSNNWTTNCLRESAANSAGDANTTSGKCSATYMRLPRRSTTPNDTKPWRASRTEVRATPNCSLRLRSAGTGEPGRELAGRDPLGEAGRVPARRRSGG